MGGLSRHVDFDSSNHAFQLTCNFNLKLLRSSADPYKDDWPSAFSINRSAYSLGTPCKSVYQQLELKKNKLRLLYSFFFSSSKPLGRWQVLVTESSVDRWNSFRQFCNRTGFCCHKRLNHLSIIKIFEIIK